MKRMKKKTRDGVFAYATSAGRRWGVDYRDPNTRKRKRKRGFRSKELALKWKDKVERQELGLLPKPKSSVTFESAVGRYVEYRLAQG